MKTKLPHYSQITLIRALTKDLGCKPHLLHNSKFTTLPLLHQIYPQTLKTKPFQKIFCYAIFDYLQHDKMEDLEVFFKLQLYRHLSLEITKRLFHKIHKYFFNLPIKNLKVLLNLIVESEDGNLNTHLFIMIYQLIINLKGKHIELYQPFFKSFLEEKLIVSNSDDSLIVKAKKALMYLNILVA